MKKYEHYLVNDFLKDELFVKWVNEKNPELDHFWNSWLSNHPEQSDVIQQSREIIQGIAYKSIPEIPQKKYNEILENVLKSDNQQQGRFVSFKLISKGLKYAAVLILGIGLSYFLLEGDKASDQIVEAKVDQITKVTERGQKLSFVLADGTTVKLNAGSTLTFPRTFNNNQREIYLQGEAFFDVARDESKPFVIHANEIDVKVLGTAFNIKSYQLEDLIQVAVAEGKVAVNSKEKAWEANTSTLTQNQVLTYTKSTKSLTTEISDIYAFTAWTDKTLVFKDASIAEITTRLERWFDVDIDVELSDPTPWQFSGQYPNKSIKQVLEGISYSTNVKYKIEENSVTIYE
ncbi:MAG: FecR domain-containing protein [Cyclobacteriaceae bacterium]